MAQHLTQNSQTQTGHYLRLAPNLDCKPPLFMVATDPALVHTLAQASVILKLPKWVNIGENRVPKIVH